MTDRPLGDALAKPIIIPDVPSDAVTIAAEGDGQDVGASVTAQVDIGKPGGWEAGAQAGWWKSTGGKVRAWLTWKK